MKVTNNPSSTAQAQSLEQAKATEKNEKAKARGEAATGTAHARAPREAVEISDEARMLQRAKELAHGAPAQTDPSRAQHLAALKASIKDGSYKIDSAAVADKLVDEHLFSNFGKNDL